MASKMATLGKAEELLEQLRAASYDAAVRDLQDIRAHAAEAGVAEELKQVRMRRVVEGYCCLQALPARPLGYSPDGIGGQLLRPPPALQHWPRASRRRPP